MPMPFNFCAESTLFTEMFGCGYFVICGKCQKYCPHLQLFADSRYAVLPAAMSAVYSFCHRLTKI